MSLSSSDHISLPTNADVLQRRRPLVALSGIFSACALVAMALWMPLMLAVAYALRPPQLSSVPAYRGDIGMLRHDAQARMWIILVASVLVILALAVAAILLGRAASRLAAGNTPRTRLETWAVVGLTVGLAAGLGAFLLSAVTFHFVVPLAFIQTVLTIVLYVVAPVGVVGSLIASYIAVHRHPDRALRQGRGWHIGARICLAVAPLLLLIWLLGVAFLAQFIISFYLHLVY